MASQGKKIPDENRDNNKSWVKKHSVAAGYEKVKTQYVQLKWPTTLDPQATGHSRYCHRFFD